MLETFDNCFLCNKFVGETSGPGTVGHDISLWTSICKIFQVSPDESQLETFPSCRLCYSCHSLALQSSDVLKKIELLQVELEELSKTLKDVFRETIILEGKPNVSKIEANSLGSLRHFLSKNLSRQKIEAGDAIQIIPAWKEEFSRDDGCQVYVEDNESNDCHDNSNTKLDYGTSCSSRTTVEVGDGQEGSTNKKSSNNFRTFIVQGHVLKDLEIKLERLPQNYILTTLKSHSVPVDLANCADSDVDVSAKEDDDDWSLNESSEASSEDDDDYLPETSRSRQAVRKQADASDCSNQEFETLEDDQNSNSEEIHCKICSQDFPSSQQLKEHLHEKHPMSCSECGKSFNEITALQHHIKRHKKDKICTHCGRSFAFKSELRRHEKVHSEEGGTRKFTCKVCNESFDSWSARSQHRKQEHPSEAKLEQEALQCQICEKFLSSRNTLRSHMKLHQEAKIVCETCGKSCDGASALKRHMKRHKKDKICDYCGKGFAFDYELNDHREKIHKGEGDQRMTPRCKPCDRSFDSWQLLLQHRAREHSTDKQDEQHQCEFCGKVTNSKANLRMHRRTHGTKKHGCVTCGSRFIELRSLKNHIQMHHANNSEQKTLPCEFCDKVCYSKLQLVRHKRYHQGKKYVCETCGKAFVDLRDLNVHTYTHSKEKPFTCELCGKGVTNLSHHRVSCMEKLNNEEKNFKCSHCDKGFHLEAALKRHEGMHLNSDRFECEVCQKKFQFKSLFMQHRRSHFPEEGIPCTITMCEARFRNQSELNWHMEYDHFGNREKCSICGYEAKSRMYFKRHMLEHKEREKRFECDLCGKKYFRAAHMRRHRRTHEKSKISVRPNETDDNLDGSGDESDVSVQ